MAAINALSVVMGAWDRLGGRLLGASGGSAILGMGVTALCAIFMLRGANWARYLYLAWAWLGVVALVVVGKPFLLVVPGAVKTIVITYFLLTSAAHAFFVSKSELNANGESA